MKHILFELKGCPFVLLDNEEHIKFCLLHASEASYSEVLKIEKGINRVFAHQLLHLCKENQWDINEFMALESSIEAHNS